MPSFRNSDVQETAATATATASSSICRPVCRTQPFPCMTSRETRCITTIQEAVSSCSALIPALDRTCNALSCNRPMGPRKWSSLRGAISLVRDRALEEAAGCCRDGAGTRFLLCAVCAVQRRTRAAFLPPESQFGSWILAIEAGVGVHRAWTCMSCCSQDRCRGGR